MVGASLGLALGSPFLAASALAIKLQDRGPVLYRQQRVGRSGTEFELLKLRTMVVGAEKQGAGWAVNRGDPRITSVGRVLRRLSLDELPQLWNVVRGEMALVGPRPEDPRYVDLADPLHAAVFGALPGITGPTALAYRDEETILADAAQEMARSHGRDRATDDDLDRAYREVVLPAKLRLDADYLSGRSTRGDLAVMGMTIGQVLGRTGHA